ncbi:calcium-binding protein [uncultured Tateyamaria sp.]|uniref:calcium-binding protein n=1 Tax=uncultured Tateyamaria sp. TaxID=455651 RepID=UPI002608F24E|nr:calcium-binding protein [uncultured Tateyamaria sp.]
MPELTLQQYYETGHVVSSEHFGGNALYTHNTDNGVPDSDYVDAVDALDIQHIRYPAGQPDIAYLDGMVIDGELPAHLVSFLENARINGQKVLVVTPTHEAYPGAEEVGEFAHLIARDFADVVHAIEIGNEYWNHQTETSYGQVANDSVLEISAAFEEEGVDIPIWVQMGDAGGSMSEFHITNDDRGWLTRTIEANETLLSMLSPEARENIDGVVEHFYLRGGSQFIEQDLANDQMISLDYAMWVEALGDDITLNITEWNIRVSNLDQLGMRAASSLISHFTHILELGADEAYIWPPHVNTSSDLTGPNEVLVDPVSGIVINSVGGAIFDLMSSNLQGLEFHPTVVTQSSSEVIQHLYADDDRVVVYVSSRSHDVEEVTFSLGDLFLGSTLTSAIQVGYDQSTSDGIHFNYRTDSWEDAISITVNGELYYINEHDVQATVTVLDESAVLSDGGFTFELLPYEVIQLVYELPNYSEFQGTALNDVLETGSNDDIVDLLAGDDSLSSGEGSDTVFGGFGDDFVNSGSGNDVVHGDEGSDSLRGWGGDDSLFGGGGGDNLKGWAGSDYLDGGSGDDVMWGGNGSDTIFGDQGADQIWGENDSDWVSGGDGNDMIDGGAGHDDLFGDSGHDSVFGGRGNDTIEGGNGSDLAEGGDDHDVIFGGNGDDTLDGAKGNDQVWGGVGDDLVIGGTGNDTLGGARGNDTIEAGNGNDVAWASAGNDMVYGGLGHDTLGGGTGNDVVFGEIGDDVLWGGRGADTMWGGAGDDVVGGGAGQDLLYGEADNDTMWANGGNDTLWGGSGDDLMGAGKGDDLIYGEAGNDELRMGQGNDTATGGSGDDTLLGANGNDVLDGGDGSDVLAGEDGNDLLLGGGGSDTLSGGADSDEIAGGAGNDVLIGGAGADTFVFFATDSASGTDLVTDFELGLDTFQITGAGSTSFVYNNETNEITVSVGADAVAVLQSVGDLSGFSNDDLIFV